MGGVFVSTHNLNSIIERAESARVRLYKNVEVILLPLFLKIMFEDSAQKAGFLFSQNTSMQELHKPVKFMEKFLKQSDWKEVTVFDTLTGDLQHLNLKEVVRTTILAFLTRQNFNFISISAFLFY